MRKIAVWACAGTTWNVSPCRRFQRKPRVSDPDMHHGTCVTHVSWCISGSLTRGGGENVPGIPGACATHNFTYLTRGPLSKTTTVVRYFPRHSKRKRSWHISIHHFPLVIYELRTLRWTIFDLHYSAALLLAHWTVTAIGPVPSYLWMVFSITE